MSLTIFEQTTLKVFNYSLSYFTRRGNKLMGLDE